MAGWWLYGDTLHVGAAVIRHGARFGARTLLMPSTVLKPLANIRPGICVRGTVKEPYGLSSLEDKAPAVAADGGGF